MFKRYIFQQWRQTSLLILCLTLTSCSNVGPYIDPPEPEAISGPGFFSGDKGYVSLVKDDKKSDAYINSNAKHDADDFSEFESYRAWQKLKSKGKNSGQYQEFLHWLEYRKLNLN